jgi:hypothetical protein
MASSWQADLSARCRHSTADGASFDGVCEIQTLAANWFDFGSHSRDIPITEVAEPRSRPFATADSRHIPAGCWRSATHAERPRRCVPRPLLRFNEWRSQ